MSRIVQCVVLGRPAEGLDYVPVPGRTRQTHLRLGIQRSWQRWVAHQTTLINEYRLTPIDPKARQMLVAEMEKFCSVVT